MELVNIRYNGRGMDAQMYSNTDESLIINNYIGTTYGNDTDHIELFVYDDNDILLDYNYDLTQYIQDPKNKDSNGNYTTVILDPRQDAINFGYDRGSVNLQYNFVKNLFNSAYGRFYWIKQISSTRTELILSSQVISDDSIRAGFDAYQAYSAGKSYYSDFYLNFGSNQMAIAVNVAFTEDDSGAHLLIKLYEPLPIDFDVKTTLWIVDKVAESVSYNVNVEIEAEAVIDQFALRGPNFKINVNQQLGQTTQYYNYQNLLSSPITSSYQQMLSYYQDKSVAINVNYTDMANFVHFSSATERINNFVYKLRLIETYNANIKYQKSIVSGSLVSSGSITNLNDSINNIINKFDNYEYYLYYSSESFAWPKRNSTKPYTLYSVTSSQATSWLGAETIVPNATTASVLYSASFYDATNPDKLSNTIPQYLQDDPSNAPYVTFMDMIGQHFDNIWIYYKDVTNRYNNTNSPNTGISMDMVGDALKGLGISLYTNTNVSDNLYYSMFGINADGSLLPPTGSEKITAIGGKYVTSSLATLPANQLQGEIYKRLYHNLPYLLKTKGTQRGIKALIACYGIPDSMLTVNEFGGYDRASQDGVFEINNNKAYIVTSSAELSGSLLSPYTTLQQYTSDRRLDTSKIEVGFSPANTINANITSSLGYFNIDQYIGNPNDQYSSSYSSLNSLKDSYFSNYTQRHSVWEYIRMVKFYNNSLFKMIKDFAPARADVSTGIIIKPHMLERNKYARHEPTATTSSYDDDIKMLRISGSDPMAISASTNWVGNISTSLGIVPISHSVAFEKYTGEFGGGIIDMYEGDFSQLEQSYQPFNTSSITQYIDLGATYHNYFNSVKSDKYFDLDYDGSQNAPVNLNLITQSINNGQAALKDKYAPYAQLQDYNYSARRSVIPRYSGSNLSAAVYNYFTPGDVSYNNDPVINHYTNKLGLFTQIATSSFFPGQVNATLGYTVDINGGLFELNQNNKNWVDIQNTFKTGHTLTIKQFDNRKYGNQKSTDGIKNILESGYSYTPLLYSTTQSSTPIVAFLNLEGADYHIARAKNNISLGSYISGSTTLSFPLTSSSVGKYVTSLFNNITEGSQYFLAGTATTYPTYTSNKVADYSAEFNIPLTLTMPISQSSVSWSFEVSQSGTPIPQLTQKLIFKNYNTGSNVNIGNQIWMKKNLAVNKFRDGTAIPRAATSLDWENYGIAETACYAYPDFNIANVATYGYIYNEYAIIRGYESGKQYDLAPEGYRIMNQSDYDTLLSTAGGIGGRLKEYGNSHWVLGNVTSSLSATGFDALPAGIIDDTGTTGGLTSYGYFWGVDSELGPFSLTFAYDKSNIVELNDASLTYANGYSVRCILENPINTFQDSINISFSPITLNVGDKLQMKLNLIGSTTSNFTASLGEGSAYIKTLTSNAYVLIPSSNMVSSSTISVGADEIIFTAALSDVYGPLYQFSPNPETGSFSSSLYTKYGDANNTFEINQFDKVVVTISNGTSYVSNIKNVYTGSSQEIHVSLYNTIPGDIKTALGNNTYDSFLIVKKIKDEQNIIMNFNKKSGETSYGFLIPESTNPTVVENINTIQASVQSQILSTQAFSSGG